MPSKQIHIAVPDDIAMLLNTWVIEESIGKNFDDIAEIIKAKSDNKLNLVLYTGHLTDTKQNQYKCGVFINYEDKEIIFANAGTKPGLNPRGYCDIRDDIRLIKGIMPKKIEQATLLNDMIISSLQTDGADLSEWKFIYTGHSLGGAISDVAAADMALKLKNTGIDIQENKMVSSTTFDNPGSKPLIDNLYIINKIDPKNARQDVDFTAINNRKNFINSLNPQADKIRTLQIDNQQELNDSSLLMMMKFIREKLIKFSFIDRIIEWLEESKFFADNRSIKQHISEHRTQTFLEAILKQSQESQVGFSK